MATLLVMAQLVTATICCLTLIMVSTACVCLYKARLTLAQPGAWGVEAQLGLGTATIIYGTLISILASMVSTRLVARQAGALMASWQVAAHLVTATIVQSTLIIVHTERLCLTSSMVARVTPEVGIV